MDSWLLIFFSRNYGVHLSVSNFMSSSIASITVYMISSFLIFNSSGGQSIKKTVVYFCYTSTIIVLASIVIGPVAWLLRMGAEYAVIGVTSVEIAFFAKVLITPPQLIANFFMSRYLAEC